MLRETPRGMGDADHPQAVDNRRAAELYSSENRPPPIPWTVDFRPTSDRIKCYCECPVLGNCSVASCSMRLLRPRCRSEATANACYRLRFTI
jgi:hypothetical protein